MKKLSYCLSLLLIAFYLQNCKKKSPTTTEESKTSINYEASIAAQKIPNGDSQQKLMDSLLLYAQQVHLWNTSMPLYNDFQPRNFSTPEAIMTALKTYAPKSATTGKSLDKYSFLDDGTLAEELSGNNPGSFGILPFYNNTNDLRIKIVDLNSPGAIAGIQRGDQVLAINDDSNLAIVNNQVPKTVNEGFFGNASTLKLRLRKANGTETEIILNKSQYPINPVNYSKIIELKNGTKVGYIVYTSFTFNSENLVKTEVEKFQAAGCTKIIVDLRYNGGGYITATEGIGNLLVPAAANGQIQYTQMYNEMMQNNKAAILSNQFFKSGNQTYSLFYKDIYSKENNTSRFAKIGNSNFNAVYFLITGGTASASELVINILKPHMNVYLVGRTSYGKPVGFIGLKIGKYDVYYAMSKSSNSKGEGDYFEGFTPNFTVYDDVTRNWGDENEALLKASITHITTGAFPTVARRANTPNTEATERANQVISPDEKSHNLFLNVPKIK